jgi:hypothetical protein
LRSELYPREEEFKGQDELLFPHLQIDLLMVFQDDVLEDIADLHRVALLFGIDRVGFAIAVNQTRIEVFL